MATRKSPSEVLLYNASIKFPKAWDAFTNFRKGRGVHLPDWPSWCYCPAAAAVAFLTRGSQNAYLELFESGDIIWLPILSALAAWRPGKGIYRFDATLCNELIAQSFDDDEDLPCAVIFRLPEWGVYVEMPDDEFDGFFAHLDYDVNTETAELRLLFVDKKGESTEDFPLILKDGSLRDALKNLYESANKQAESIFGEKFPSVPPIDEVEESRMGTVKKALQLVLYICSANADMPSIPPSSRRSNPNGSVRVQQNPRTWEVGFRIGAAIRAHRNAEAEAETDEKTDEKIERRPRGENLSPRPHIRRAHWHHFWTGAGRSNLILKWLPPIPVGTTTDMPITLHLVDK